jgi:ferredoxin
MAAKVAE